MDKQPHYLDIRDAISEAHRDRYYSGNHPCPVCKKVVDRSGKNNPCYDCREVIRKGIRAIEMGTSSTGEYVYVPIPRYSFSGTLRIPESLIDQIGTDVIDIEYWNDRDYRDTIVLFSPCMSVSGLYPWIPQVHLVTRLSVVLRVVILISIPLSLKRNPL